MIVVLKDTLSSQYMDWKLYYPANNILGDSFCSIMCNFSYSIVSNLSIKIYGYRLGT